jgi:hypothetical protein
MGMRGRTVAVAAAVLLVVAGAVVSALPIAPFDFYFGSAGPQPLAVVLLGRVIGTAIIAAGVIVGAAVLGSVVRLPVSGRARRVAGLVLLGAAVVSAAVLAILLAVPSEWVQGPVPVPVLMVTAPIAVASVVTAVTAGVAALLLAAPRSPVR